MQRGPDEFLDGGILSCIVGLRLRLTSSGEPEAQADEGASLTDARFGPSITCREISEVSFSFLH